MILLVDNYDSFSYNLYQMLGEIDEDIKVIRNDEMSAEEALALRPKHLVVSPGPGRPRAAGMIEELILKAQGKLPILGVCLGHQAISEAYGGRIAYAKRLMHGKSSSVFLSPSPLFAGLPSEIRVARYHSLALDPDTVPSVLKVTARTQEGEIMAVEHKDFPTFGLQFHPESILTEYGAEILKNFLSLS